MYKQAAYVATDTDKGSYAQLFNPISFLTGGGDRVPTFVSNMMPNNPEAAWLVAKMGAIGLLTAAVAGGVRLGHYVNNRKAVVHGDDPNKYTAISLDTTVEDPIIGQKKSASEEVIPGSVSFPSATEVSKNALYVAAPLLAAALGVYGGYKIADKWADQKESDIVDESIAQRQNYLNQLIEARARLPKGNISDKEVNALLSKDASFCKQADDESKTPFFNRFSSALGLLALSIFGISAFGAYQKTKKNSASNIEYKAIKKGLDEYTRTKSMNTPLTMNYPDAQAYFDHIDGSAPSKADKVDFTAQSSPVSMTF